MLEHEYQPLKYKYFEYFAQLWTLVTLKTSNLSISVDGGEKAKNLRRKCVMFGRDIFRRCNKSC
jgi:hypothetical protein